MPLFNRGQAPLAMFLDGPVLRVIFDGEIVWDGTRPALVQLTRLRATVTFPNPAVSAQAVPAAAPLLTEIDAAMLAPSVRGSSVVSPPPMLVSVAGGAPGLITDAEVEVFGAAVSVVMMEPSASENFDGVVSAPPIEVSAVMPTPAVLTGFFVAAVPMSVSAAMGTPVVTVTSTGQVPAVVMLASVLAPAPAVVTGANVAAVKQQVNAMLPVPVIFAQRNVNITAVKMTGSAAMVAPVVSGSMNPQGMQRTTATLQLTTASTYQKLTPMQAKSGFESTLSSDGLVMPGGGVCDLAARVTWNSSSSAERRLRIMKNGATQLGEVISTGTHSVINVTVDDVTLSSGDVLTLEGWSSGTASARSLDTTTAVTYLTVTPN